MRWSETITLIKTPEVDPEIDAAGYPIPQSETARVVYCKRVSIGAAEFYQAHQAGVSIDFKVILRSIDYQGERIAEIGGKRYQILRTYMTRDEYIELTLDDTARSGRRRR